MTLLSPWLSNMAKYAVGPMQVRRISSYQECEGRSAALAGTVDWNTFTYQPLGEPDETTREVLFSVDDQYGSLRQRLELAIADTAPVSLFRITGIALCDAISELASFFKLALPIADGFIREICLVVMPNIDAIRLVLFYGTKCLIDSTYSQAFVDDGRYSVKRFPEHVRACLDGVRAAEQDLPILSMSGDCSICAQSLAGQCVRLTCGHVVHRLCHFESMRHEGSYGLRMCRDASGRWRQGNLGHTIVCGSCWPDESQHGRVTTSRACLGCRDGCVLD